MSKELHDAAAIEMYRRMILADSLIEDLIVRLEATARLAHSLHTNDPRGRLLFEECASPVCVLNLVLLEKAKAKTKP